MHRAADLRDRLVQQIESQGFGAHGVHVLVGEQSAEHHWRTPERRDIHSVAKGVCVLAAGIAADAGLVDLDEPIGRSLAAAGLDDRLGEGVAELGLRRLLNMTSGIDLPWTPTLLSDWPDLAREFLGRPSRGAVFQYSNASTYTAMRLLGLAVGDVGEYVDRVLLAPLGIRGARWERCPNGYIAGGGGLALSTGELARIGRLIRDGGSWNGERLVSARWPAAMHGEWVAAGESPGYRRYALAGWDGFGGTWRLHGAYGQLQIHRGGTVVTITADDHAGADPIARWVAAALD
ncbi:serine hydrolase domain-containing protein [Arenivirga flava]|uniref:Penicillin-binding protein n=1 Tax=Arenivirga flava TaxID=1930060 RepID=A0AA37UK17_9MICO|nr:serine hydrolase [Arenivirga flava]GMA28691.1 penicillin-binding protein [Arenivirga flava]